MPDVSDMDLVREYAERNSEPAFAELVRLHINLVYSVALRFTHDPEEAHDVTQAVFIILASKAASLRPKTILTGWLYETTRFTALKYLRDKIRQQAREQEAYMQSTLNDSTTDTVWKQLSPYLEEAMTRLNEKERTLVALRYFENKSGAETAALLGIEECAARQRIGRAVGKLRNFFIKRGIIFSAAVLTAAISANSVQAAPAVLAKTATAVALAQGATASISTLTLVKGALKIMAWSKAKTVIVAGVAVILAAGTTTTLVVRYQHQSDSKSSSSRIGTNPGDFAPAKMAGLAKMKSIQMTLIPAFIAYARDHDDDIPQNMADLQSYLPPDTNGIDYANWEILAHGKLTTQLTQKDILLLQQKTIPSGQYGNVKIIGYTDGHFTIKK